MSSPSLRPLIDTCQKCSTSPANHEPRSPANGSFQNPGVCPQAVPSFPSPTPTVLFLALAPFSAQAKYRSLSLLPNPTETLAMQATPSLSKVALFGGARSVQSLSTRVKNQPIRQKSLFVDEEDWTGPIIYFETTT